MKQLDGRHTLSVTILKGFSKMSRGSVWARQKIFLNESWSHFKMLLIYSCIRFGSKKKKKRSWMGIWNAIQHLGWSREKYYLVTVFFQFLLSLHGHSLHRIGSVFLRVWIRQNSQLLHPVLKVVEFTLKNERFQNTQRCLRQSKWRFYAWMKETAC